MDESDRRKLMLRGPTGERAGPLSHAEVALRRKDGEINANWLCSSESGDMWLPVDRVIDDPDMFDRLEAGGENYQRRETAESAPRNDGYWTPGSRSGSTRSQARTPPSVMPSVRSEGKSLEGLENWLAVLGFVLWVNFIRIITGAFQLPELFSGFEVDQMRNQFPSVNNAINMSYFVTLGLVVFYGICLFLYHTKHYLFPTFFIVTVIIGIVLSALNILAWSSTTNSIAALVLNEQVPVLIASIIFGAVWITYVAVSKRVAVTFTQHQPSSVRSREKMASAPVSQNDSSKTPQRSESEVRKKEVEESTQSQKAGATGLVDVKYQGKKEAVEKEPSVQSRYRLDGPLSGALDQPLVLERSDEGPTAAVSAVVEKLKKVEGQRTGGFLKLTDVRRLGKTLYLKFEADVKPQKENTLRRLFSELLQKEMVKDLGLQQGLVRILVLHSGEICWEASIWPGERGMTLKVITG